MNPRALVLAGLASLMVVASPTSGGVSRAAQQDVVGSIAGFQEVRLSAPALL